MSPHETTQITKLPKASQATTPSSHPTDLAPSSRRLQKLRILGIDPGTGICGFGVIEITSLLRSSPSATPKLSPQPTPSPSSPLPADRSANFAGSLRGKVRMVDAGVISTPAHTPLADRLLDIFNSMHEIIDQNHPDIVSIEKLFFSKNITTGISVAEARGVVLLVCKQHNLPVYEYTPNEIKKTLTGYGSADKKQMQEMVKLHLNLAAVPQPDDAADALAAAITHTLMHQ